MDTRNPDPGQQGIRHRGNSGESVPARPGFGPYEGVQQNDRINDQVHTLPICPAGPLVMLCHKLSTTRGQANPT